jgi:hypothetical protein
LDISNEWDDNWKIDNKSGRELDTSIDDMEIPEHCNASATPNICRLSWLTGKSKHLAEMLSMMVNAMDSKSH